MAVSVKPPPVAAGTSTFVLNARPKPRGTGVAPAKFKTSPYKSKAKPRVTPLPRVRPDNGNPARPAAPKPKPKPKPKAKAKPQDPIDKLYAPALQTIADQRARANTLNTQAQTNLNNFRKWQADQAGASEQLMQQRLNQTTADRTAAISGITQNLADFANQARIRLGLGGDAATRTGFDAAQAAGGSQMNAALTAGSLNENLATALTQRQADMRRYDTALGSNMQTNLNQQKQDVLAAIAGQERELRMGIAKSRLQAEADARTAAALAGQQGFENQLALSKLESSNANAAANRALRQQEINNTALWRSQSLEARNARLATAKTSAAKKTINEMYKTLVQMRQRSEAAWAKANPPVRNPITGQAGTPKPMSQSQMLSLIRKSGQSLRNLHPNASPKQIYDALTMVFEENLVSRAGQQGTNPFAPGFNPGYAFDW